MKNHRVVISRYGEPETLQLIEEELPAPAAGEVLVRVQASGTAFGDVLKRRGLIPGMPRLPYTPGYDLAGRVVSCGEGVHSFKEGDRVCAFVGNHCHAEWVRLPATRLVKIPGGPALTDPAVAASLILNYVTALQLIQRVARLRTGDRLLVHGAAGGLGTAALQLGKLLGLEVYGTASAGKHELVRRLGGVPIDYKSEDFVARLQERGGAHAVFDPIGGAHLARSRAALTKGGSLVLFGTSSSLQGGMRESTATFLRLAAYKLWPDSHHVHFYGIENWPRSSNPQTVRDDLGQILAWHAEGKLDPVIGARFALARATEAYRLLEAAQVSGKIVLTCE